MTDEHGVTADEPVALADVNFFDPAINDCPFGAYRTLRDEAPVWFDERLQAYVITRHDDPNHREMRALFNHAFRPKRIAELELHGRSCQAPLDLEPPAAPASGPFPSTFVCNFG